MSAFELRLLRASVVFVWLATAIVSLVELNGQGTDLLIQAGIRSRLLAHALILGGAALDAAIGVVMVCRPSRLSYGAALATMLLMTLVATALAPSLWLHPLGPLTKNVPLAAALWILMKARR
ncbi:MAG: DoxX-like family protein [Burkholderiaceae bacterium]|jgi:hypothetical protein|nr:DoxX-like family protein [Burkholderiaceae bacterium]